MGRTSQFIPIFVSPKKVDIPYVEYGSQDQQSLDLLLYLIISCYVYALTNNIPSVAYPMAFSVAC